MIKLGLKNEEVIKPEWIVEDDIEYGLDDQVLKN